MEQLEHPLDFTHKFNLYKLSGLLIADDDLASIARVYGISLAEIEAIEAKIQKEIAQLAAALPPARPEPLDPPVTILAVGDSITSDRASYVKILNHYWRDDPSRRLLDSAISGDTTASLIKRFYSSVLNQDFQWAILFIGTNDCLQLDDTARIPNLSSDEYRRNLKYLTAALLERGANLVQVTIPPMDNVRLQSAFEDSNSMYTKEQIGEINAFIREHAQAQGYAVADLARAVEAQDRDVLEPDGLHLNGQGHLILSRLLLEILP